MRSNSSGAKETDNEEKEEEDTVVLSIRTAALARLETALRRAIAVGSAPR